MTEDQIKWMVDRFLMWVLPEDFHPDNGIHFERVGSVGTPYEFRRRPQGTNLFDAVQAAEMVRHMIEGMPSEGPTPVVTIHARISALEASLARIEDMLTAEKPTKAGRLFSPNCGCEDCVASREKPARKSLGWANFYPRADETFITLYKRREDADAAAVSGRKACIEIFEGEGL